MRMSTPKSKHSSFLYNLKKKYFPKRESSLSIYRVVPQMKRVNSVMQVTPYLVKIHFTGYINFSLFIEHALTELECLRFLLKEPFKVYNSKCFLMVTLKFRSSENVQKKLLHLLHFWVHFLSINFKPIHIFSQNFASSIHVLDHILSRWFCV